MKNAKKSKRTKASVAKTKARKGNALLNSIKYFTPFSLIIILIDFLSHFLILSLSLLLQKLIFDKVVSLDLPDNIIQLSEQQILNFSSTIHLYYYYFIFLVIALILLVTIVWSISRAVLWRLSFGKKVGLKYIMKAIPLGLMWFVLGAIPGILLLATFKPSLNLYVLITYLVVFVYFSDVLFLMYAEKMKVNIFGQVLKTGFGRLKDLGLAFVFVGVIFYLILSGLNLFRIYAVQLVLILAIIVYLFYFAWSRFYLIEIYKKI